MMPAQAGLGTPSGAAARRLFTRIAVLLLALPLLWARGAQAADEVTLMFDPADRARPNIEKLQRAFNRRNPDVRFRIIWSNISPKMHLLTAADALPDLIPLPDFSLVLYHEQFLDLGPYLARTPHDRAQVYPQLLKACRYEGKLKMLPTFYNVPLLYYRPDLFRKAGVPYPDRTWTWDTYRAAARKLTTRRPDGKVQVYGTSVELGWWVEWLGLVRQAGGDLIDPQGALRIGEEATRDGLSFMHALIHEDRSAPTRAEAPTGGFLSGRYAMVYGGHVYDLYVLRSTSPFEWDIAPLPSGPRGRVTGEFAVAGYAIWKKAKNKEAAWRVLSFLMSREAGLEMARGGFPPVRRDVAREEYLAGTPATRTVPPRHREALTETLTFARSVPKHKDFIAIAQNAAIPLIQQAMDNPDPAGLGDIHTRMEASTRGFIATLGRKKEAPKGWFYAELFVLGALAGGALLAAQRRARRQARRAASPGRRAGANRYFFAFTAPFLVGISLLYLGPLVTSFYWAHTDYSIVEPARFVGWAQFASLFGEDPYFWHSLRITFVYALLAVPSGLAVALAAALLLSRNLPGMGVFRTLFYLPGILPVAASGIMWAWFLHPRGGVINRALAWVGVEGPGWLLDPAWALPSLVVISLWGFGGPMLIFLAGLKNIPTDLYEAAGIDGAGRAAQFRHITLPALSPVVFFNLSMGIIGALQIFDIAYVLSALLGSENALGEPQKATYFYVLNLYEKAFVHLKLGLGSAMAWVLFAIILLLTLVNFWARRFWVFSEAEEAR